MRVPIYAALLALSQFSWGQSVNQAKAESQELLNAALPFAEKMLSEHGAFYPYAYSMKLTGEIVSVAGYDGNDRPPSQAIIDLLQSSFKAEARAGIVKATAVVYDVWITDSHTGKKTDAIAVALDHRDNYSVIIKFPYLLSAGKLTIGDPIAEAGSHSIFVR